MIDALVIGAGVVGLAVARELALAGQEVVIAEAEAAIGLHTSARNSEVIHAGLYYPEGSLKARLCVEGRALLYRFCESHGVTAKAIGKLVVAVTDGEIGKLEELHGQALRNGVTDVRLIGGEEARRLESALVARAALVSPSTGIIDGHGFMLALQGAAEDRGAALALNTRFLAARRVAGGFAATLDTGGEPFTLATRRIVNAAGHGAHRAAAAIEGVDAAMLPPRFLAKGNYCAVSGKAPFSRLIYPIPIPGALGTHVTLDLGGAMRLGPDLEWVTEIDYRVRPDIAPAMAEACATFWPAVREREVTPSSCGIRPKIHGPDQAFADFAIHGAETHGVAGLVNLFGIESPGLTASLAIAREVKTLLDSQQ